MSQYELEPARENPNLGLYVAGGIFVLGLVGAGALYWWNGSSGSTGAAWSGGVVDEAKAGAAALAWAKGQYKGQPVEVLQVDPGHGGNSVETERGTQVELADGDYVVLIGISGEPVGEVLVRRSGKIVVLSA